MKTLDEMRTHLLDRADDDMTFRSRLLAEPKAVVQDEFGIEIPDQVDVQVHEDSPAAVHMVLPPEPKLEVGELQSAAGGLVWNSGPNNWKW